MTTRGAALSLVVLGLGAAACGGAEPAPGARPPLAQGAKAAVGAKAEARPRATSQVAASAPKAEEDKVDAETRALVAEALERVAKARGLPIKRSVKSLELDRPAMIARIKQQVEKDMPMDVVVLQGEMLAALELVPADYDFIAGTYRMIEGQIAGFYTPDDQTMYLADDLSDAEANETLAHELVHALQDQTYALGALLKYAPGDSDRISAIHALVEGDATSAMLDVTTGSAFNVSESMLRRLMALSAALTGGADTPPVLQAALTAPYADGFAFVQAIRRRGGWKAVDDAWRAMPQTTEQLLHVDKYAAREPALSVPVVPLDALGAGWQQALDDVMGEQGLRITLEMWTNLKAAREGAAGWGGDRFMVARKAPADAASRPELAAAWFMRLDTERDAREVTEILQARFGTACRARPDLGPITWRASGSDVVIVAGPYERQGGKPKSTGACATANRWAESILKKR